MAGIEDPKALNDSKSAAEARSLIDDPAITFAHQFALNNGRNMGDAFEVLAEETTAGRALNVQALCWFLQWGAMTGNTLNSFYFGRMCCKPKKGSWLWFEIIFTLYWGPLFVIVWICSKIFGLFPEMPSCFNSLIGAVLWMTAGIWIVPAGIISILFVPCFGCVKDPICEEKSSNDHEIIAE